MRLYIKCLVLFVLSAVNSASFAQSDTASSCSSCLCSDDPTPAGVMISHIHEKSQWMFSYKFMNSEMGKMRVGTSDLSDNEVFNNYLMTSDNMRMDMHMLMAMYGVSEKLTLMGMINYNYNQMTMRMFTSVHHHHGTDESSDISPLIYSSGFADFKLHALYGIINSTRHHLLISAGLNIPVGSLQKTGSTNTMYSGLRLPYSMQLGSGTFDILNTLNYLYKYNKICFSSQISSIIRPYNNSSNYRYGNEYFFNNWFAWQWAKSFSSSLRLEAQTAGSISGLDKHLYAGNEPASNPKNYGGRKLMAYVGTNIFLRGKLLNGQRLGVEAGLPMYQYLNGPQMKMKYTLFASWSLLF